MMHTPRITAGLIGAIFASSALAQDNPPTAEPASMDRIETCITEAVDAVEVPGARAYYDRDDQGYKKYLETQNVFAGISAFVNPYGEDQGVITDTVHFMTKYYHETGDNNYIDMSRSLSITFLQNATIDTDDTAAMSNNAKHMISDFDDIPEYSAEETAARHWAHDAGSLAALQFTICMGLEPYEPSIFAGNRPAQPPVFPQLEAE